MSLNVIFSFAVVDVTFEQSQYTFSEGDEQGTVSVQISRQIAKALSVNVAGSEYI